MIIDYWVLFDVLGTMAFALSGAMVGLARRMDIFGISVLAIATAVGGGMIRDVLVGITPPMTLRDNTNFLLAVGVALAVSFIYRFVKLNRDRKQQMAALFNISDTIGLAAFTITGALTGFRHDIAGTYVLPMLLAAITAVGGGMIRDVLAQRMPVVLHADVYAVASLFGAFTFCVVKDFTGMELASWITFFVVVLLRLAAIHFHWNLYKPRPPRRI